MSLFDIFKKKKPVNRPLRDKKGRPYYLKGLPWYKRHPRAFVIGGGTISMLILFSAPIYHALFTKEEDLGPYDTWWPHEIRRGKRNVDIIRERIAAAGPSGTLRDVLSGPYKPPAE